MRRRRWRRGPARRCPSPTSRAAAAGGGQYFDQAAGAGQTQSDPFEEFFRRFDPNQAPGRRPSSGAAAAAQPRTREAGSLGSGFIISPDGYVVTNNHLIQGASGTGTVDSVTVITTDRKEYPARIVGRDETSDLALLKIDGRNLPYVQWGDSTKARVGDWVLAIGNPYGLGGTVTAGIISALHRGITGVGAYDRYIQTDASINMGNSGGPMFDLNGNVIGINSALISPTGASVGIGLAIPAELAKPVIDALRKGQRPQRGYLGVGLQPLDEDLAPVARPAQGHGRNRPLGRCRTARRRRPGCSRATSSSAVNGQNVTPDQTVSYLIANTPVGSRVPLDIIRGGKRQTVTVVVGERPTEEALASCSGGGDDGERPRRRRAGSAAARAWPVAGAADARTCPRGQPAGDRARRDRHRGRSQQRCRRTRASSAATSSFRSTISR